MPLNYPLRFSPVFRRYLWGGRRLGTDLGRPIGPENDYAESWEIVDHGNDQCVVRNGPFAGTTLGQLVRERRSELFGEHPGESPGDVAGRSAPFVSGGPLRPSEPLGFPLLFKYLDAHKPLSVQVHPDDRQAARLQPPDRGKTEAWVILHAEPGSVIHAGLRPGVDSATLRRSLLEGTVESCLHNFHPSVGDCVFIPAGTVHALGAGLLVAEIQQSSDTTYRLFDWNRLDAHGKARPLHIEESLTTIDFRRGPIDPIPRPMAAVGMRQRLVRCDKFELDRYFPHPIDAFGGDSRFHLLVVVAGRIRLGVEAIREELRSGDLALLPASMGRCECESEPGSEILEITVPIDAGILTDRVAASIGR
jgi:mannose-6-phosphate isomerase